MNAMIKEFVDKYAPVTEKGKFHEDLVDLITEINSTAFLNSLQAGTTGRSLASDADKVMEKLDLLLERQAAAPAPALPRARTPSADTPFGSKQAKELAEKEKIPAENIVPTGKTGKITKADVQKAIRERMPSCTGINVNGSGCSATATSQCPQSGRWFCKKHKESVELVRNVSSEDKPEHFGISKTPDQIRSANNFSEDDAKLNALTQVAAEPLEDDSDDELSSDRPARAPAADASDAPAPAPVVPEAAPAAPEVVEVAEVVETAPEAPAAPEVVEVVEVVNTETLEDSDSEDEEVDDHNDDSDKEVDIEVDISDEENENQEDEEEYAEEE